MGQKGRLLQPWRRKSGTSVVANRDGGTAMRAAAAGTTRMAVYAAVSCGLRRGVYFARRAAAADGGWPRKMNGGGRAAWPRWRAS
ncbi:IQ domain-containing GTPase activating protein [Sesbania bispinosa]|nr:IQ domain-containing GTPase activating protein [Sesbania bispinosa]